MYKILILTFKAYIDRTAPLYLCELIKQQKTTTDTRLAGDAFFYGNFHLLVEIVLTPF